MAIPNVYTAGQILEAASLNANFDAVYATSTTYTPVVTGWTQGNATMTGRYAVSGDLVTYYGSMEFGSTSAVTASGITVSLPVTAAPALGQGTIGLCKFNDLSAGVGVAGYLETATTTTATCKWFDPETAPLAVRVESWATGATLPFTFATGDFVYWQVIYRKA